MFLLIQIAKETEANRRKTVEKMQHPTKSNQAAAIHNKLHTSSNVMHNYTHTRVHTNKRTWQRFNRCVLLNLNLLLRINLIRCAKLRAALWQHRTCIEQKPSARNVVNDLITTTRQQWLWRRKRSRRSRRHVCKWFEIWVPSCMNWYVVDNYWAQTTAHVHSN